MKYYEILDKNNEIEEKNYEDEWAVHIMCKFIEQLKVYK